jgi:alkylation response protein AidB-like acyl-CoA dehydrogenase
MSENEHKTNSDETTDERSFMASLCMGKLEEDMVIPFPEIAEAEKEMLNGVVDAMKPWLEGHELDWREWDEKSHQPDSFVDEIRQMGLFGLIVPEEHGGMGFSNSAYSRTLQELASYDGSLALTAGAHSSIGMKGLVLFGTKEQQEKYFPSLASGEMIAAFCLTEPGAGSDAAAIKAKAVDKGDHWELTGEKIWISNGGTADFFTVFALTDTGEGKMTGFFVTRDMEGVSSGPHEDKMGIRANSTTTVHFDKVKVPKENVCGPVGKGFKVAMEILNNGRTGLGGGCVGGMKKMVKLATKQAKERHQFGTPIAEFGLIKQKLGHMVVEAYASEALVSMVGGLIDSNKSNFAVEAAISKVFTTEALWRTIDEALQVAGGNGFMKEFPYERAMRDSRVNRIFEGTNEILRLFIALTAMRDVGKSLKEVSKSVEGIFNDPIKGFGVLSSYAKTKVYHATGVGSEAAFTKLDPALASAAKIFEDGVKDVSSTADRLLRKHGKNIIGKQFATKRLADIMIDLFTLTCVLSRVNSSIQKNGLEAVGKELEILEVFSGQVQRRMNSNFNKIDNNDDELIKSLADHALELEKFGWDTI